MRRKNEDCFYVDPKNKFFLVADGVGGRHRGEIASISACNYISMRLPIIWNDLEVGKLLPEETHGVISKLVREASNYLKDLAEVEAPGGMGTTLTGVLIWRDRGWIFHVGDTRCYFYRKKWQKITRDDSLAQSLVDQGVLSSEEWKRFPYKNVITQALGLNEEVVPHIYPFRLKKNLFLLLSSDGFHGFVDENEWQKPIPIFLTKRKIGEYLSRLLDLALEKGGKDNITLVGVMIR